VVGRPAGQPRWSGPERSAVSPLRMSGGASPATTLPVVEGGEEGEGGVLLGGEGAGDRPPVVVGDPGRIRSEKEWRRGDLPAGHGEVDRDVVALEPPAPGVGARFAEHGRPVVAGVAAVPPGRISGAPGCPGDTPGPPGPAALALVEDVLEPADRRHPGVRRTGDGGDEQAVHRPGRFPGHLGQRHAPPAARGVVPVAPAGIVEREAQRRLLVGRQRGDEAPRRARHRHHGRAKACADRGHRPFIPSRFGANRRARLVG